MVAVKTSLALLSLSAAALMGASGVEGKKHNHNYGRHMKMAKRGPGYEDMAKRADDYAPFGYDKCGVPRSKPYVKGASASPSPSANWKPCPPGTPGYKLAQAKLASSGGSSTGDSSTSSSSDASVDSTYSSSADSSTDASSGSDSDSVVGADTPTANASQKAVPTPTAPSASSTESSSPSSTPAPTKSVAETTSSSSSSSADPTTTSSSLSLPGGNVKIVGGWGKSGSSSTSSSEDTWTSSSAPAPASSSPAPAPSSGGWSEGQGMLGVAWDWQNPSGALAAWAGAKRVYTWSAFPPSDPLPDGMEWYPQYWGPGKQGDFESQVAAGVIKPGMTILGYNEPDQAGQANLSVEDGINSYLAQITPYAAQGYRLATPACTSDDNGFNWISGFINGCAGRCGFSVLQTHYYGTNSDAFIAYIQKLHDTFGLPIIVSEYAAETFGNGPDIDAGSTAGYVGATQAWLKSQSFIDSYFYFGPETTAAMGGVSLNNQMINDDGSINALGYQYLNNGK